jgi:hypothetical protein
VRVQLIPYEPYGLIYPYALNVPFFSGCPGRGILRLSCGDRLYTSIPLAFCCVGLTPPTEHLHIRCLPKPLFSDVLTDSDFLLCDSATGRSHGHHGRIP